MRALDAWRARIEVLLADRRSQGGGPGSTQDTLNSQEVCYEAEAEGDVS